MEESNPTYLFLENIRQRTIIIVPISLKIQNDILRILETTDIPHQYESLIIRLGHGESYEVDYGKYYRKDITTGKVTFLIEYLREVIHETPDIYDPFNLLIRNVKN